VSWTLTGEQGVGAQAAERGYPTSRMSCPTAAT